MPSIFTPTPAETERKEPGFGGKPPVDRRPTGGGGGGGDDDWKPHHRGPREALYRTRTFVFCALAGDMMFFVILVALFYARQSGTHMDPRTLRQIGDWRPVLLPPILFLNTAVIVLSSLCVECAGRMVRTGSAGLPAGSPLARRYAWPRPAVYRWTGNRLETVNCAGICFRQQFYARKLFLLCDYRPARRPPRGGSCGADFLRGSRWPPQASRVPADRR